MIDGGRLLAKVVEGTGGPTVAEAEHALTLTLAALGGALDRAEAEALAEELPGDLAAAVRRGDALLAEERELPPARVAEYAPVVCAALAEVVGADVAQLLARRLPPPWRALFHRRDVAPPPTPPYHAPPRDTLAAGRAGSRHAIADHATRDAQDESVARANNPHEGEKLSSGRPR